MRWFKSVHTIAPFIYILSGGAVLYSAETVFGIAAGTLLVSAGAIVLQMRHDCQRRGEAVKAETRPAAGVERREANRFPEPRLETEKHNQQTPGTK